MSTAFSRSLRTLRADSFRASLAGFLTAAVLLGGWAAWCARAPLTLYELSSQARMEVDRAIYPVQSPLAGRVTKIYLTVGRLVQPGDVLVELDASPERLQLQEEQTRLSALAPQVAALQSQVEAEQRARADEQQAARVAAEEARANARQAEAPAQYNAAEEKRLQRLRADGLIAERDYQRGQAEARQARYAAEREQIAVRRVEQEQRTRESNREVRLQQLRAEITRLEGQATTSKAALERLRNEIERRVIRATVAGRLGEASTLRPGTVVQEGEKIGAIVPDGRLLVVAQYPPPAALGRIVPGQKAKVRLQGFPWMQYGVVPAVVSRVAGEVRDGAVRVELAVDESRPVRIPLQHGLPGTVEVEVEHVTPAALILQHAGRLAASPRSAFTQESQTS